MGQYDRMFDLKCMPLWPIFHGPLICLRSKIWWMSVISLDNETVWHKLWPQNKYRSTWPIFQGLVILLYIFKVIWWVNIIVGIYGSVWHKDWHHQVYVGQWPIFYGPAILLHILKTIWWRNVVLGIMDQCDTKTDHLKYVGERPIFHGPLIFPFIIVIDLNYLYTLRNGTDQGYSCPSRHLL